MQKLQKALTGIKSSEKWPDDSSIVEYCRINDPPSFIVKLALTVFLKSKLPMGGDKSDWKLPIKYKNGTWILWDWKRYAWNLAGPRNSKSKAEELIKKIKAASTIIDRELSLNANEKYKSGEFSLQNQYYKLRGLYDFFRERSEKSLEKKHKISRKQKRKGDKINDTLHSLTQDLNLHYQKLMSLEANTIAAVVFFLAMVEVIMDSCFSLNERRGLTYSNFKNMNWSERLKWLVPVGSSHELNKLFAELVAIRSQYRNLMVHSSPEFFFHIPYFGLLPSTYKNLYHPHVQLHPSMDEEKAKYIFETFDQFEAMLCNRTETKFGMIYAESGLPIHIDEKFVSELKDKMDTIEEFKSELEKRASLQDAFDNMDI